MTRLIGQETPRTVAMIVYSLFVMSFLLALLAVIGVVIAYLKRRDADGTAYESHMTWLIRTFWGAVIGGAVAYGVMYFAGPTIGYVATGVVGLWYILRVATGFAILFKHRPLTDPDSPFLPGR